MNRALRTAASGMLAQQMQVDTIANNIANVNTTAYKKDRLNFRSMLYSTMREPGAATAADRMNPTGLQVGSGIEISSSAKSFVQGDLEQTNNVLDLAIQGDGFFKIDLGNGEYRYTRDGSFRQDASGYLVTVDGFRLDGDIKIDPQTVLGGIIIGQDGTMQTIAAGQTIPRTAGTIRLSRFANPAGLKAEGANFFSETVSSGKAEQLTAGKGGTGFISQGFLERSNVFVVDELINLIQAQRNYEINSRTIQVSDEMLQQVSSLIR